MDHKSLQIRPDASLTDALRHMDEAGMKILLVVDDAGVFLGTMTDGDVRRHIIKTGSVNGTAIQCTNRKSRILRPGYSEDAARHLMLEEKREAVPIIDEMGKPVSLLVWNELFRSQAEEALEALGQIETPVVIMAGGRGTRLDPFTRILPKPLIPIGEQTILEMIMERFHRNGVKDFHVVINYKGELIKSYFDSVDTDYRLNFVREPTFLGTGGGLRLIADDIGERLFVSNCDIIVDVDFAEVQKFHVENGHVLTMIGSCQQHVIPYGVVEFTVKGKVNQIVEKPTYDLTVNTGIYLLDRSVIEHIPPDVQFHVTDLIEKLIARGESIGVFPVSGKSYLDIGQWEEYRKNARMLID